MDDNCGDVLLNVSRSHFDRRNVDDNPIECVLDSQKIIETNNGDAKNTGTSISDSVVTEAVKKLLQVGVAPHYTLLSEFMKLYNNICIFSLNYPFIL